MSNLEAKEYFEDFFKGRINEYFNLIRVVRVDSPNSIYKKAGESDSSYTTMTLIAIVRTDKKEFYVGDVTIGNYEEDNETIKKNNNGSYFSKTKLIADRNLNRKEIDILEQNKSKQDEYIQRHLKNILTKYGVWSIIQDEWDPNNQVDFIPTKIEESTEITEPLPVEVVEPIPIVIESEPIKNVKIQSDFNFDVKKDNTFIITNGDNGNLVTLPDGTTLDIGELEVVKKEDPNDPEIIRIITPYSDQILEIDSEYTDQEFAGEEQELTFIDSNDIIDQEFLNSVKGYNPGEDNPSLSTDTTPISKDKEANARIIVKTAKELGVTNEYSIAAILSITNKESGLIPKSESSYSGTPSSRIKSIFSKFRNYSDDEVDTIKKDHKKFFDIIYGNKYGNSSDDGYKYRGRGFNQITFKGNYEKYKKKTNIDIVNNPDKLNEVDTAAKCLVEFFKSGIGSASKDKKELYNFSDINSFKTLDDAVGAFYHANAGFGKPYTEIIADSTGGRRRAFSYSQYLYDKYAKE